MKQFSLPAPNNELPSLYAERLSTYYASKTTQHHKKELGQFFTPLPLSNYIASFSSIARTKIKILDPGCGTCVLSCSLIEKLIENPKIKSIELTTYEVDPKLNIYAAASLSYLEDWLSKKNVTLKVNHRRVDFVSANALAIDRPNNNRFDVIISNPPYFKISKRDERKKLLRPLSNGQLNIYAVFVSISINMLNDNGELIYIIPRSFASGEYFKTFRNILFSKIQITDIHLFESRKDAFSADAVLQENVILKGNRVNKINSKKEIRVSQSRGLKDISHSFKKKYLYSQLINNKSEEKFLYLPNTEEQEEIMTLIRKQKNNLSSLGYKISTGPIVYFRKREFLQKEKQNNSAPLYWLDNIRKFNIQHPMNGKSKEQFFRIDEKSNSVLIKNKNVVIVRRFSSKDDSARLIAAAHLKKSSSNYEKIGIENKLNYITKINSNLSTYETIGITALLNSYIYDEYFKTFNGNTQVSASELRKLPFPSSEVIIDIGKRISRLILLDQTKVDGIICNALMQNVN